MKSNFKTIYLIKIMRFWVEESLIIYLIYFLVPIVSYTLNFGQTIGGFPNKKALFTA